MSSHWLALVEVRNSSLGASG